MSARATISNAPAQLRKAKEALRNASTQLRNASTKTARDTAIRARSAASSQLRAVRQRIKNAKATFSNFRRPTTNVHDAWQMRHAKRQANFNKGPAKGGYKIVQYKYGDRAGTRVWVSQSRFKFKKPSWISGSRFKFKKPSWKIMSRPTKSVHDAMQMRSANWHANFKKGPTKGRFKIVQYRYGGQSGTRIWVPQSRFSKASTRDAINAIRRIKLNPNFSAIRAKMNNARTGLQSFVKQRLASSRAAGAARWTSLTTKSKAVTTSSITAAKNLKHAIAIKAVATKIALGAFAKGLLIFAWKMALSQVWFTAAMAGAWALLQGVF